MRPVGDGLASAAVLLPQPDVAIDRTVDECEFAPVGGRNAPITQRRSVKDSGISIFIDIEQHGAGLRIGGDVPTLAVRSPGDTRETAVPADGNLAFEFSDSALKGNGANSGIAAV